MSEEVSSPNMATGNTQFISREHQWDLPDTLPVKLESDYGYVCGNRGFVSTRDDLIALVRRGQPLSFVWTPDTPEPVYPEAVPFLLDALRANQRRTGRNAVFWGAGFIAVAIVLALGVQDWRLLYRASSSRWVRFLQPKGFGSVGVRVVTRKQTRSATAVPIASESG